MALLICTGCTASYAVGAPRCPQCGSTDYVEEGQDMPKLTVHGGASDASVNESEGGEHSSPGNSSSASSERAPRSRKKNAPEAPSPAPTTESPSPKGQTGSSTAGPTDGDPTAPTSAADQS